MKITFTFTFILIFLFQYLLHISCQTFELVQGFKWLNFTFATETDYQEYFTKKYYKNCMLAGIKANSLGEVFVSIPRWKDNVPATFAKGVVVNNEAILSPWPNWESNKIGDPNAMQSILGFEIDLEDNIYILDQGKINGKPAQAGAIKLLKYSQNGALIRKYDLSSVADPKSSFLNDLVLDMELKVAYITDSGINVDSAQPLKPAIIVLNLTDGAAHRVLDSDTSVMPDPSFWLTVNNENVLKTSPMKTGADGIALSCDGETLYYTPLSSRILYSVPTKLLLNKDITVSLKDTKMIYKGSASDGLLASSNGNLYMTSIETNAIYLQKNIDPAFSNFEYRHLTVFQGNSTSMWPDTLAMDRNGYLLFTANQLNYFVQDEIDFDNPKFGEFNFYIWRIKVNDKSYLHRCSNVESTGMKWYGWVLIILLIIICLVIAGGIFWKFYLKRREVGEYKSMNLK